MFSAFIESSQMTGVLLWRFALTVRNFYPILRVSFLLKVDFENPDLDKFPRFSEIEGLEVAMEPGEVLYIPNYWWHYIESEMHR